MMAAGKHGQARTGADELAADKDGLARTVEVRNSPCQSDANIDVFNVRGEMYADRLPLLEVAVRHNRPDLKGKTWQDWHEKAEAAQPEFRYPIRVSRILEDHATDEQKAAKIDIVDLIFEEVKK